MDLKLNKARFNKVLVFRKELLRHLGYFQGYSLKVEKYLPEVLNPQNNFFIERNIAESNQSYKQIIPYIVLRFQNSLFTFKRGISSNEKRLVGLYSVGLGGHIEETDQKTLNENTYLRAIKREIDEEVKIRTTYSEHILALINDDSNFVGKVHFGIMHIWDLKEPNVISRAPEIAEGAFCSIFELGKIRKKLEKWSQIALEVLTH